MGKEILSVRFCMQMNTYLSIQQPAQFFTCLAWLKYFMKNKTTLG